MAIAQETFTNAQVSLFYDPAFVDTFISPSAEAYNLNQILGGAGHTVTTFTGTDTSAWRNATQNANVLVIPSLDNIIDPATQLPLSTGAMFFLKDFVSRGGTLIVTSEVGGPQHGTDLLDAFFDTALNELNSSSIFPASTRTAEAAGTVFASGGTPLPGNDSVDALAAASLPAFATSLYETAAGNSTVVAFQFGKGQVIWLGWDWYQAAPAGGQDGGWNDILRRSVSTTDLEPNGLIINGTSGNDRVTVDPSLRAFNSTDRDDAITLKKGNDKAFGGAGHDVINGDKGNDKLHGDDGDDILCGGKDKDKLWGDAGGDYFLFDQTPGTVHADKIKDFLDGVDLILLEQSKFGGLTVGDMTALQFSSLIEYTSNGWLLYDGQKFAKLQSGLAISEVDFLVV